MSLWRTRVGLAITLALVAIAIFGPLLAPHARPVCRHTLPGCRWKAAAGCRLTRTGRVVSVPRRRPVDPGGQRPGDTPRRRRRGRDRDLSALAGGWVDRCSADHRHPAGVPADPAPLIVMATVGPKTWLIVVTVAATTMPRTVRVMRGLRRPSWNVTSFQQHARSATAGRGSCASRSCRMLSARLPSRRRSGSPTLFS